MADETFSLLLLHANYAAEHSLAVACSFSCFRSFSFDSYACLVSIFLVKQSFELSAHHASQAKR